MLLLLRYCIKLVGSIPGLCPLEFACSPRVCWVLSKFCRLPLSQSKGLSTTTTTTTTTDVCRKHLAFISTSTTDTRGSVLNREINTQPLWRYRIVKWTNWRRVRCWTSDVRGGVQPRFPSVGQQSCSSAGTPFKVAPRFTDTTGSRGGGTATGKLDSRAATVPRFSEKYTHLQQGQLVCVRVWQRVQQRRRTSAKAVAVKIAGKPWGRWGGAAPEHGGQRREGQWQLAGRTDGRTRLQVVSPLAAEVNLAKVASAARSHAGFAGSVCRVAAVRSSREEQEWGKIEAEKIKAKPPVKSPSASSPLRRFHSRRTSDAKQPPCPGESRANPGRSSVSTRRGYATSFQSLCVFFLDSF